MYKKIIWMFIAILIIVFSSACSSSQKTNLVAKHIETESAQTEPVPRQTEAAGIPVLMYHSIAEEKGNDAVISKELFAKHMDYLYQHKYYTASLDELYDHLTGKKALPSKTVVLTFDDGYNDTYTIVMPILKQYGFKSVVFVPAADIGKNLTVNQLQEMKQAGMTIASHSDTHRDLGEMSYEEQVKELVDSKEKLDKLFDQNTRYFCYPDGSYNASTIQLLKQKGFKMAFTINPGWVNQKNDLFLLKRVWMGNSIDIPHLEERLTKEDYSIL